MTSLAAAADGTPAGVRCGHRGCVGDARDRLLTLPTVVTLARTAIAVAFAVVAISTGSTGWLAAALVAYWVGDVADGALARLLKAETRTGAVLDIVSDRCCVAMVYLPYATWNPEFAPALGVYAVEFLVVDLFLSLAFLRWPILSPNYFGLVDRPLHRLNWTLLAKGTNSAGIAVAAVLLDLPTLALVVASALLVLKVGSLVRLVRLPAWRDSPAERATTGCVAA